MNLYVLETGRVLVLVQKRARSGTVTSIGRVQPLPKHFYILLFSANRKKAITILTCYSAVFHFNWDQSLVASLQQHNVPHSHLTMKAFFFLSFLANYMCSTQTNR